MYTADLVLIFYLVEGVAEWDTDSLCKTRLIKGEKAMSTQLTRHYTPALPSLLGRGVFDDIFGQFFNDAPTFVQRTTQGYPVVDIFQGEDGSTIMEFALAGFSRSDINVEVKPETRSITVSVNTDNEDNTSGRRIARRNFSKTYVNYDDNLELARATAKFENGLLTIHVPPRPEVEPLRIEIE